MSMPLPETIDGCHDLIKRLVTQALEEPVKNLLERIKESNRVHMDETGHRRDGLSQWLWGIMSNKAAFFSVEASRGKKVIASGIVISDRYAAYNYFTSDKRQICWAHLKRDFTKVSEKKEPIIAPY